MRTCAPGAWGGSWLCAELVPSPGPSVPPDKPQLCSQVADIPPTWAQMAGRRASAHFSWVELGEFQRVELGESWVSRNGTGVLVGGGSGGAWVDSPADQGARWLPQAAACKH